MKILSRQNATFSGEYEPGALELARLICYPQFSEEEHRKRLKEIDSLGVGSLVLGDGGSTVNGISICGKGCVGLVFQARMAADSVALKIRRTDADRQSMDNEARLQQIANSTGVGPRYIGHSENLIAMEFISGQSIMEWIGNATTAQFRKVARSVLEQCFKLDKVGLDHGELSRLGRHVIVTDDDTPYIIDFESASLSRKTINVSSASQSLFLYGSIAAHSKRIRQEVDTEKAITAIRKYKQVRTRESFDELVTILAI